jgi:hypothetical protein
LAEQPGKCLLFFKLSGFLTTYYFHFCFSFGRTARQVFYLFFVVSFFLAEQGKILPFSFLFFSFFFFFSFFVCDFLYGAYSFNSTATVKSAISGHPWDQKLVAVIGRLGQIVFVGNVLQRVRNRLAA